MADSIDPAGDNVRIGEHSRADGPVRHDDSLATILLASRLCADGVRPLKASEYWGLLDGIEIGAGSDAFDAGRTQSAGRGEGSGLLIGQCTEGLIANRGMTADLACRISELMGRATAMAFELDRLERSGIRTLTVFDEYYPQKWLDYLRQKAPPVVHAAGALDLLDTPGLGVVGSRDVSQEGGEVAREVARIAARRGLPLVSGGARGVDQLAMDAAFEAGGAVVGILAESLARKLKRPDVRRAVYDDSTVMCIPYNPDAPFSAGNAMGRNKLIYAQAVLTVVVASDHGAGGTWSGATEALKHGYGPVAVWRGDGEGPGNEPLQQLGAIPVAAPADIEKLIDDPPAPTAQPPPARESPVGQQSLFAAAEPG